MKWFHFHHIITFNLKKYQAGYYFYSSKQLLSLSLPLHHHCCSTTTVCATISHSKIKNLASVSCRFDLKVYQSTYWKHIPNKFANSKEKRHTLFFCS